MGGGEGGQVAVLLWDRCVSVSAAQDNLPNFLK